MVRREREEAIRFIPSIYYICTIIELLRAPYSLENKLGTEYLNFDTGDITVTRTLFFNETQILQIKRWPRGQAELQ